MAAEQEKHQTPTLRDLYPNLTESELAEAEENFSRYIEVVLRIYDRLQGDPEAIERWRALTDSQPVAYDDSQRSNPTETNLSTNS